MGSIIASLPRLAARDSAVLISGESGTGKELIARAIHAQSPRADKPFIALNCGALPQQLIESELFGCKRGAFTDATRDRVGFIEAADGGTLFLDEIAELPVAVQGTLLRVLQEGEVQRLGDTEVRKVSVRILAATCADLEHRVHERRFREDLYFRLNVLSIHLPPLRVRRSDIPPLITHILETQRSTARLSPEAYHCLLNYSWPGNVRELYHAIEHALAFIDGDVICVKHLPERIRPEARRVDGNIAITIDTTATLSIKEHSRTLERELIQRALVQTGSNKTRAARLLNISVRALDYKIKEFGGE
jgi:two-component system response regulator AtoC